MLIRKEERFDFRNLLKLKDIIVSTVLNHLAELEKRCLGVRHPAPTYPCE